MGKLPYEPSAVKVKLIASHYLSTHGLQFRLDDELKRLYRLMTLYFTDNPDFETYSLDSENGSIPYSLKKGILLIGPPGRSKTFCFESVFRTFTTHYNHEARYRIVSSYTIQQAFEQDGIRAINSFRTGSRESSPENLYIDEIGAELLSVNHFGNKQNPVQSFLHERHRLFVSSQCRIKTHASSNLVLNSNGKTTNLKTFYGDRIYSRLFEMFNIIITNGKDLRINIL